MSIISGIAEGGTGVQSSGGFPVYNYRYIRWKERAIQLTDDAKVECRLFRLDMYQIVDMLDDPTDCPKFRQFHKIDKKFKTEETEVCSKKDKKIFRIIYCEDDCIDVREICWLIIHVKPA